MVTAISRPQSSAELESQPGLGLRLQVRRFPYPYRAMLAICSDLDETPGPESYFEQMRFLNTTAVTAMGEGVGLEVGNSMYFAMRSNDFCYWNADEVARAKIRSLIRSGHIDCLHSYGDTATHREDVCRVLDELDRHDCAFKVWVDHAVAPTNFGADIMRGHGDERGHAAYHADLTVSHGIRYVWRGRVTSVIGQDRPLSYGGIGVGCHPLASATTLLKECVKQRLARCGSRKYRLHGANRTLAPARLRDGTPILEFLRSNPHWGGVSRGDRGDSVQEVITEPFLEQLVRREGTCILYTHLGKLDRNRNQLGFDPAGIAAFRLLQNYFARGQILVTTTRRLLDYLDMISRVTVNISSEGSVCVHDNHKAGTGASDPSPQAYAGLTVTITGAACPRQLFVEGRGPLPVTVNGADETGQQSITVPWSKLSFPDL